MHKRFYKFKILELCNLSTYHLIIIKNVKICIFLDCIIEIHYIISDI